MKKKIPVDYKIRIMKECIAALQAELAVVKGIANMWREHAFALREAREEGKVPPKDPRQLEFPWESLK